MLSKQSEIRIIDRAKKQNTNEERLSENDFFGCFNMSRGLHDE